MQFDYDAIEPNVEDSSLLPWESQCGQYPARRDPGITYFRGNLAEGRWVDCLLYYDDDGELAGILNHYPQEIPPYEKEGGINVWVHPQRKRLGIGSALIMEALQRWPLRGDDQRFSSGGAGFAQALVKRLTGSEYDFRTGPAGD